MLLKRILYAKLDISTIDDTTIYSAVPMSYIFNLIDNYDKIASGVIELISFERNNIRTMISSASLDNMEIKFSSGSYFFHRARVMRFLTKRMRGLSRMDLAKSTLLFDSLPNSFTNGCPRLSFTVMTGNYIRLSPMLPPVCLN